MQELPRRSFIAGGLAAGSLVLAACGGGDDDTASESDGQSSGDGGVGGVGSTAESELTFLIATFPDGFRQEATLVAGPEQRFAFVVADQIDNLRDTAPAALSLSIAGVDGTPVLDTTIDRRVDGIITPYYPATVAFPAAGLYVASLPEFPDVAPVEFLVAEPDAVAIPQVGDQLPVVPTPTFVDPKGVADICTRAVDCQFHEIDLVDAAANDLPTVLLVATPGFCQTDICGPVVDLLIDEAGERDDVNVIHAEVYVDPSDFETGGFPDLTDIVQALALPFEPALFVADADNTIVARLDTTFDRSELRDALALV